MWVRERRTLDIRSEGNGGGTVATAAWPVRELPDISRLSVRTFGTTLDWTAGFRRAMRALCRVRGVAGSRPERLRVTPSKAGDMLLVWPAAPGEHRGYAVRAQKEPRGITTALARPMGGLGATIPDGICVELPVTRCQDPEHGPCLALHLRRGEFRYLESRGSAIGLQDEEE